MYAYAWYHWLTFFYLYCFFGWIFESAYVSLRQKQWVNRGFLRLPMLPIYGSGAVMMLWISLPVRNHPILIYLVGVIAATILEYVTGYAMEKLFKVKYWDYSSQRFNLNGYICLSSSIAWGFLTLLMTQWIHRPIERMVLGWNPLWENAFLAVVSCLFVIDMAGSVREALKLAQVLESITRLRTELNHIQAQLAMLKEEAAQNITLSHFSSLPKRRVHAFKEAQKARVRTFREAKRARIRSLNEKLAELQKSLDAHLNAYRHDILHRNPSASSRYFAEALNELRKAIEKARTNAKTKN